MVALGIVASSAHNLTFSPSHPFISPFPLPTYTTAAELRSIKKLIAVYAVGLFLAQYLVGMVVVMFSP